MTGFNFLGYEDLVENRISGFLKQNIYLVNTYFYFSCLYLPYLKLEKRYNIFFIYFCLISVL